MTEDELAAVIAAVQTLMPSPEDAAPPEMSAWKREARLEAVGVY